MFWKATGPGVRYSPLNNDTGETHMKGFRSTLGVLALIGFAASAQAQTPLPVPMAKPVDVGLSAAQLKKIEEVTAKNIDEGIIPGAVMLVARHGKVVWVSAQGKREAGSADAMKTDTIFRIYSMTKPMVSLALMQMVEEGRLQVTDPVSKYLPEIGNMKVGTEATGPDGRPMLRLSDPARQMTVQDLMRHTAGLVYGARGTSLVYQEYQKAKIGERGASNAEFVSRLSKMPLHYNPGDRWEYSVSVDVQGRLLEVLNGGKPLGEVLAERIFKPLGMTDTSFQVPADKLGRVAQPAPGTNGKATTARFKVDDGAKYQSGGGGLMSTTEDYLRFTAALANNGAFNGKRIIGRQTLAFMAADHTGTRPGRPPGFGFGLGFEVRTALGDSLQAGSIGEYGWSGAAGTTFWVDPKEQLYAIYMVQANDADTRDLRVQFRSMVQAAIVD
jgi:CubicO group peptidase (beta-lactamase class C family)